MTPSTLPNDASPDATLRQAAQQWDQTLHSLWAQSSMGLSPIAMTLAYMDWAMHLATSPGQQMLHAQDTLADWQQQWQGPTEEKDARFHDATWQQWPYRTLKDSYKTQAAHWLRSTQVQGMSDHHRHMVQFFTRQWLDAL